MHPNFVRKRKKRQFHLKRKESRSNGCSAAALRYKPQQQSKMGKKIQAVAYNGMRTVCTVTFGLMYG